ncbi:MAG: hypothetical protein ACK452_12045 [Bacteroidota bacterium]|jgi:hypothetical protein
MNLSANWFTDNLIDLEFKKYILLGYLQEVRKQYSINKVFPHLNELILRRKELLDFISASFQFKNKGQLLKIDIRRTRLEYDNQSEKSQELKTLFEIAEFAIPLLSKEINDGVSIYDFVKSQLKVEPVGILPINKKEGYVLIHIGKSNVVHVYRFLFTGILSREECKDTVKITYCGARCLNYLISFEKIKMELILNYRDLPNPAVYKITCPLEVPIDETLLPIAKDGLEKKQLFS